MAKLLLFNKPYRVLSQFSDQQERQTLAEFIAEPNVYPAGRLDYDSEGLLLLTDHGALQARISHPRHKMVKCYRVQVEGSIDDAALQSLQHGISLKDGPARALNAHAIAPPELWPRDPPIRQRRQQTTSWLELQIDEGRNRQVRRMTAAVGFPTLRLVRWQIGQWSVANIAPGHYRTLNVHLDKPRSGSTPHANHQRTKNQKWNKHSSNKHSSNKQRSTIQSPQRGKLGADKAKLPRSPE